MVAGQGAAGGGLGEAPRVRAPRAGVWGWLDSVNSACCEPAVHPICHQWRTSCTAKSQVPDNTLLRMITGVSEHQKELLLLAGAQHGLVTRQQARELGFSNRTICRCLDEKAWVPMYRGVFRLAGFPTTFEQRVLAGCRSVGPDAAASPRCAGALMYVPNQPRWGRDHRPPGKGAPQGRPACALEPDAGTGRCPHPARSADHAGADADGSC